jgi:hypothetical protein
MTVDSRTCKGRKVSKCLGNILVGTKSNISWCGAWIDVVLWKWTWNERFTACLGRCHSTYFGPLTFRIHSRNNESYRGSSPTRHSHVKLTHFWQVSFSLNLSIVSRSWPHKLGSFDFKLKTKDKCLDVFFNNIKRLSSIAAALYVIKLRWINEIYFIKFCTRRVALALECFTVRWGERIQVKACFFSRRC